MTIKSIKDEATQQAIIAMREAEIKDKVLADEKK